MLYQLYEMGRNMINPTLGLTQFSSHFLSNPMVPFSYSPLAKHISAGLDLMHRIGKDYEKPEWEIESIEVNGQPCAVTPVTVEPKPFCNLIHFEREFSKNPDGDVKILIVAPLSGHHSTLLRDTVKQMLTEFDVYITDWIDARMVPLSKGPFHLDTYVYYIQDFIRLLGPDMHIMSVCQPTVPVMAAVSLMSSKKEKVLPKSMILMGGPIDTRKSPTEVNSLAFEKPFSWFENQLIYPVPARYPGFGRQVYPGFLQHAGFVAMNPDKHLESHYTYYLHLMQGLNDKAESHRRFYDEYNAVLDMPAEYYLDTIKTVFQDHLLPRGLWDVGNERVKPQDIKNVRLLTIEGELDDITGNGQTKAAHELCSGIPNTRKKHFEAEGCGHYGIFSGSRWRKNVFPVVAKFIHDAT